MDEGAALRVEIAALETEIARQRGTSRRAARGLKIGIAIVLGTWLLLYVGVRWLDYQTCLGSGTPHPPSSFVDYLTRRSVRAGLGRPDTVPTTSAP